MLTLAAVFRIGLTFPSVEESTYWATRALKVNGQMMACVPTHKSAEPNSLHIRIDRSQREAMIAEAPELYYCPDHYRPYDSLLIRLPRCTPELAHDLLAMAHRFATRKPAARKSTPSPSKSAQKPAPRRPRSGKSRS
jgi:hypothetical protein